MLTLLDIIDPELVVFLGLGVLCFVEQVVTGAVI